MGKILHCAGLFFPPKDFVYIRFKPHPIQNCRLFFLGIKDLVFNDIFSSALLKAQSVRQFNATLKSKKNSKFFKISTITYQHFCHEFLAGHQLYKRVHGAHRPTPIIHCWFICDIWGPDVSKKTARGLDR